jgi:hypothetical protein
MLSFQQRCRLTQLALVPFALQWYRTHKHGQLLRGSPRVCLAHTLPSVIALLSFDLVAVRKPPAGRSVLSCFRTLRQSLPLLTLAVRHLPATVGPSTLLALPWTSTSYIML